MDGAAVLRLGVGGPLGRGRVRVGLTLACVGKVLQVLQVSVSWSEGLPRGWWMEARGRVPSPCGWVVDGGAWACSVPVWVGGGDSEQSLSLDLCPWLMSD